MTSEMETSSSAAGISDGEGNVTTTRIQDSTIEKKKSTEAEDEAGEVVE